MLVAGIRTLFRQSIRLFGSSIRQLQGYTHASEEEVRHFNALASSWWDVQGPQRILHKMNIIRMEFVNDIIKQHLKLNEGVVNEDDQVYVPPYNINLLPPTVRTQILQDQELRRDQILDSKNLRALDVGCGGGIFAESIARLNYIKLVKGIDLSPDVLEAAKLHKQKDPFVTNKLTYELKALEDIPKTETYDVITAFEMLEHVNYPAQILSEIFHRVNDGGWVFLSTINRNFASWLTTIFAAEDCLRIVPKGTHNMEKFIDEAEIRNWLANSEFSESFRVVLSKGCMYVPARGWVFNDCTQLGNYFMAIQKIGK